jgi:hypothetical protein
VNRTGRAPHLKLVPPPTAPQPAEVPTDGARESTTASRQMSLFPESSRTMIYVLDMTRVSASGFTNLLRTLAPKWIMDLRPLPQFNIDRLSRQRVFGLFQECGAQYRDIAGQVGAFSRRDAALNAGVVVHDLTRILSQEGGKGPAGPVLVLVDDRDVEQATATVFPDMLRPRPRGGWKVQVHR